ncbi:hypothetical protein CC80DRAFT_547736 [Byssothecium circinans]|uniref:Uncharacterized protein n=1 Tax=Byssothecium circinans TaxID=147558 RepID=A0A6A5TVU0_9PLEO|nr:hypothetical protein CC80DRAFT_547736 [Byssothecium circinans]
MSGVKRPASPTASDLPPHKKWKNAAGDADTADAQTSPSRNSSSESRHLSDPPKSSPPSLSHIPKTAPTNRRVKAPKSVKAKADHAEVNAVPIGTLFDHKPTTKPTPPKYSDAWGSKPCSGLKGANSYPDQPPARSSNAQTVPPLWEDRKYRYQKGSRFVKSFQKGVTVADDAPDLDQEENLLIKLIDMRPRSAKDPTPRRLPTYYVYQQGKPLDWDNKQAVKAINDRRQQAIDRFTLDRNWTKAERNLLASIFHEVPDVSIKEATDRFNTHFKDRDFVSSTAFTWDNLSTGRTIESVRFEYLSNKRSYDAGEAPQRKELNDKTEEGRIAAKILEEKFGKADSALMSDDGDESDDEVMQEPKAAQVQLKQAAMRGEAHVGGPEPEPAFFTDDEEELLQLAGYVSEDERPASLCNRYVEPAISYREVDESYDMDDE